MQHEVALGERFSDAADVWQASAADVPVEEHARAPGAEQSGEGEVVTTGFLEVDFLKEVEVLEEWVLKVGEAVEALQEDQLVVADTLEQLQVGEETVRVAGRVAPGCKGILVGLTRRPDLNRTAVLVGTYHREWQDFAAVLPDGEQVFAKPVSLRVAEVTTVAAAPEQEHGEASVVKAEKEVELGGVGAQEQVKLLVQEASSQAEAQVTLVSLEATVQVDQRQAAARPAGLARS